MASTYTLNDTAFAPPEGITELIDITNELMPEGMKAGEKSIADIDWVKKVMESKLSSQFIEKVTVIAEKIAKSENKNKNQLSDAGKGNSQLVLFYL